MTREQRAHPRYKISLAVEIAIDAHRFTATTRDVSSGGCCVECGYPLSEGAEVSATLFLVVDGIEEASLPGMTLTASVQWTAESDETDPEARHIAGLRFVDATEQQVQWLAGVIQRCSS